MRPNVRRVVTGRMSRKFTVTHPATSDWQPAGVSNNRGVIYPADTDALQFAPEGTRLNLRLRIRPPVTGSPQVSVTTAG
ncbi:hypothetical protein F3I59_23740 [Pantoea sp. VH_8]|nr:hypothetical protein F3I59_23740 [Pantoea sp. VH_8]KAA5977242.1 hypothetical protein F3I49_23610 [Pantoea sp. M_4]